MARERPPTVAAKAAQLGDVLCFAIYSANLAINRAYEPLLDELARISHTIFARSSKVERGFGSFCGDVLARGVGRREQELGLFRCCGCSEQFDLSVGLGTIPRFLRVAAPRVTRASRARWRLR
jgi:hypothetical protein